MKALLRRIYKVGKKETGVFEIDYSGRIIFKEKDWQHFIVTIEFNAGKNNPITN